MNKVPLLLSIEPSSNIEQGALRLLWLTLRRRRTSDLPIRGISREWAKNLFSVPSESLWCDNFRHHIDKEQEIARTMLKGPLAKMAYFVLFYQKVPR